MHFTGRSLAFAAAGFLGLAAHAAVAPQVKVLIGKSLKDVVVHGTDLRQEIPSKSLSRVYSGRQTLNFNCRVTRGAVMPSKPLLVASLSSPTGLVGWENKRYRGELHLVANAQSSERGCDLVNLVPMETYISSLLAKEMKANWPLEALKAQAVAARSYALAKISGALPWHLESSEKDQVSGSFFDTSPQTDQASHETEGQILVSPSGHPVAGFFHSKCGGKTLRPDQVWSERVEGYRGVDCPFCHRHGRAAWQKRFNKFEVSDLLSKALQRQGDSAIKPRPDALTFVNDLPGNPAIRFYDGNVRHEVRKSSLRNLTGRVALPSNHFRLLDEGTHVRLQGEGYGHGVGLCQLGAYELAKRGYSYREILQHYFPGLTVKKAW